MHPLALELCHQFLVLREYPIAALDETRHEPREAVAAQPRLQRLRVHPYELLVGHVFRRDRAQLRQCIVFMHRMGLL